MIFGVKLSRASILSLGLLTTAAMLSVGIAVSATVGATDVEVTSSPNIIIVQTSEPYDGDCLSRADALSYSIENTDDYFRMSITVAGDLCAPIETKAVIYAMPGVNGVAWPQTLLEVLPFTIQEAGSVTVDFTKGCDPVQFDVLTGDTPDEIAPWATHHGPLLFPNDIGTALQFWGSNSEVCVTSDDPPPPSDDPPSDDPPSDDPPSDDPPSDDPPSDVPPTAVISQQSSTTAPSSNPSTTVVGQSSSGASGSSGTIGAGGSSGSVSGASLSVTG